MTLTNQHNECTRVRRVRGHVEAEAPSAHTCAPVPVFECLAMVFCSTRYEHNPWYSRGVHAYFKLTPAIAICTISCVEVPTRVDGERRAPGKVAYGIMVYQRKGKSVADVFHQFKVRVAHVMMTRTPFVFTYSRMAGLPACFSASLMRCIRRRLPTWFT